MGELADRGIGGVALDSVDIHAVETCYQSDVSRKRGASVVTIEDNVTLFRCVAASVILTVVPLIDVLEPVDTDTACREFWDYGVRNSRLIRAPADKHRTPRLINKRGRVPVAVLCAVIIFGVANLSSGNADDIVRADSRILIGIWVSRRI